MEKKDFKGVWIPKEIAFDHHLSIQEKLILSIISALEKDEGCYCTNSYFKKFLKVSKTRISTIISSLVKKTYIEVFVNKKEGNKRTIHTLCKGSSIGSDKKGDSPINDYLYYNNKEEIEYNKTNDSIEDKAVFTHLNCENIESKNFHTINASNKILDLYVDFFKEKTGASPKTYKTDKEFALEIFDFFINQHEGNSEEEAIKAFNYILSNWSKLDQFFQKQISLKNIKDNLNQILFQLQNKENIIRSISDEAKRMQDENSKYYEARK